VRLEGTSTRPDVTAGAALVLPRRRLRDYRETLYGDLILVLFLVAQVLDGWFTYLGILQFGSRIEANPLLTWLMGAVGEGPALAAAKTVAVACGAFLHLVCVHHAIALLTVFYVAAAIGPWIAILFFWS
jgi:hypothetical protein